MKLACLFSEELENICACFFTVITLITVILIESDPRITLHTYKLRLFRHSRAAAAHLRYKPLCALGSREIIDRGL